MMHFCDGHGAVCTTRCQVLGSGFWVLSLMFLHSCGGHCFRKLGDKIVEAALRAAALPLRFRGLGVAPKQAVRPCLLLLLSWAALGSEASLSEPRGSWPLLNKVVGGWRVGMTLENNVGMDCCISQLLGKGFVPWPVCRGRARRPRGLPQLQGTAGLTLVEGGGSSVSWS